MMCGLYCLGCSVARDCSEHKEACGQRPHAGTGGRWSVPTPAAARPVRGAHLAGGL